MGIQRLDICRHIDQWHYFMIVEQNHTSVNKFWMANYAAELNVQLHREAQRSGINTFDLPISINVTYKIGNEIENIQYRYKHEYEIPQNKIFENLIREDTFFETVYIYIEYFLFHFQFNM